MSSVDFLFTPTVQRVLGMTLAHPDRSFTLQELLHVPQLELFDVASRLQQNLARVVQFNVNEPEEWGDLVKNDPVVSQIVNGPRLQVLPHARTS